MRPALGFLAQEAVAFSHERQWLFESWTIVQSGFDKPYMPAILPLVWESHICLLYCLWCGKVKYHSLHLFIQTFPLQSYQPRACKCSRLVRPWLRTYQSLDLVIQRESNLAISIWMRSKAFRGEVWVRFWVPSSFWASTVDGLVSWIHLSFFFLILWSSASRLLTW